MIKYRFDVIEELKDNGYSTYKIQHEKLLSQSVMQKLREKNTQIDMTTIDNLCKLLDCQPGDIIKYVPDKPKK